MPPTESVPKRSVPWPAGRVWFALAVLVGSVALFVLAWDSVTEHGTTVRADRSLVDFMVRHRTPLLTDFARALTQLCSAWIVIPVAAAAFVVLAVRGRFASGVFIALSTVVTATAVQLVKELVARPRPPTPQHLVTVVGQAFPSGHAAQSVACYGAIAWIVTRNAQSRAARRATWSAATIIALSVGWSRVYLGVHWPSDVVGGWSLAIAIVVVLVLVDLERAGRAASVRQ